MAFTTPQDRVEYFEKRLALWQRKHDRFIVPAKKEHAKKRIAHYETKLAEARALVAA